MSTAPVIDQGAALEEALDEVRDSRLLLSRLDRWLIDEIRPHVGRRLLEVGGGHGNCTELLLGCDVDLIVSTDLDAGSTRVVTERFANDTRVQARTYDICRPADEELKAFGFDTVFSLNVLEHIEDDRLAMRHMAEILTPGGRAILIVPSHQWAYGTMDSSIGHYRRYSKRSMSRKLTEAGFAVERQFYLNLLGLFGWFVNARVLKKRVPPRGQLSFFNRLVPLLRGCEGLIRPPCGLSVVTVARKPGA